MGKEKVLQRQNSIWSFLGFRGANLDFFRRSLGFTLVELLVVIGVLGILITAALLIVNPVAQIQKANDAKRKADLSQVQRALETYFNDTGKYPLHSTISPTYRIVNLSGQTADWGTTLFSPYMAALPKDPRPQFSYIYFASSDRQSYYLYASLETSTDQQFCRGKGDSSPCASLTTNGIATNACGGTCNFAVTSSNVRP